MPLGQVGAQVPPQPSGPPQLPAQVAVHGPPSLSAEGTLDAGTDGPDSADTEEQAEKTRAANGASRAIPKKSIFMNRPSPEV